MRCVVLVALLGACIEPSLDVCGGLACPDGSRCIDRVGGPQCLVIADCDGKLDGESCDPRTGQAGMCESGACAPIERCGNGVLEANETCDCGDETVATRAECSDLHNSDTDALSPCRTNCTLRRCGDGILDPTEQCEGATIQSSLSCSTFGFYDGSLGCNNLCIADTSGCVGRCGDGTLDPREFCDPGVSGALAAACTDFGFATGVMTCSSLCSPSFVECRDVSAVQELLPLSGDMIEISEGPTAATAWVLRRGELDLFDELTGIKLIALTPAGLVPLDVSSYDDRAAVSYNDGSIRFFTAGGTAGTLAAPQVCGQVVMTTDVSLDCLGASGSAWWNGVAWGALVAGTNSAIEARRVDDTTVMYSNYTGSTLQATNVFTATPSAITPMRGWTSTVQSIDYIPYGEPPTTGGYYGGLAYGGVDYGLVHYTGSYWENVYGSTMTRVANIGGRTMWNDGITEVARIPPRTTTSVVGGAPGCTRFLSLASTGLCLSVTYTGAKLYRVAGATSGMVVDLPVAGGQLADAVVTNNDLIYYTTRTLASGGTVPASSWTPPSYNGFLFDRFGGISGSSIVMLGHGGTQEYRWLAHQLNGAAWTFHNANYWITAAATPDGFVASGVDPGSTCHVYRFSNGVVTTIDTSTSCWSALWRSPNDVVWAVGPLGIRNITTQTTVVPMASTAVVSAIAGRDDTHIWAGIGAGIWFWNGATWTKQLDAPGARFDWISVSSDRVIASSGGDLRTTWIYDSANARWNKMHLPSDTTPLLQPMLRPWGIVYRTQAAALGYSVWHDDWP